MTTARIFLLSLLLCFIHCAYANHANKVAVQNAYANWCAAISTAKGNSAVISKFYAPGAVLLPTLSPDILVNRNGGLSAYFTKLTQHTHIKCIPKKLITQFYGDMAVNSGLYDFSYMKENGETEVIPARFTFVYEENDHHQWLIVEHHSSMLPNKM
ncbi:MAG: Calcium/calmodulin dependent protein kinase Association [Gammaproteobacteria bacterium]|jgi:hypothetical protein|nr:Calcium/calmodulin dependent protein kinase Association [Gammaproteobacteria bacterium]